jgi:predicted nucleic acid-binding protein
VILYLDTSALVKRYIVEPGSEVVNPAIAEAELVGIATIGRAELSAALAKAVRTGLLEREAALATLQLFRHEWPGMVRVQVTEAVVIRADALAWDHSLRGYDAVHLAAASIWQEMVGAPVTMVTFDRRLWAASRSAGVISYPADLAAF